MRCRRGLPCELAIYIPCGALFQNILLGSVARGASCTERDRVDCDGYPLIQAASGELPITSRAFAHRCTGQSYVWISASAAVPPGFEREEAAIRVARLSLEVFLDFRDALQNLTAALQDTPATDTEARWKLCARVARGDLELAEAIAFEIDTMDFSDSLMYFLFELEAAGVSMDEARCYTDRYVRNLSERPARMNLVAPQDSSDASKPFDAPAEMVNPRAEFGPATEMNRDQSLDVLLNLLDSEVQQRMASHPVMVLRPTFDRPFARGTAGPSWCSAPTGPSTRPSSATAAAPELV